MPPLLKNILKLMSTPSVENCSWEEDGGMKNVNGDCGRQGNTEENKGTITGKSFSEALIPESDKPQYDKRLFIEFPKKYKFTTCCVQILF